MIKATELRIGNKVLCPVSGMKVPRLCTVEAIEQKSAKVAGWIDAIGELTGKTDFMLEEIEPVLLTEEWLRHFGFKPMHDGEYEDSGNWHFKATNYVISYDDRWASRESTFSYNGCTIWCNIQYVHQLQNLYFALTGEELMIKE